MNAQAAQPEYVLEMRNISKSFPGVKALSDVTFNVRPGEIHAICGENGAGKSTLMKVLSGVYPYGTYEGQIVYNGEECTYRSIRDSEHDGIVVIQQELALSPFLSIAENIFLGNERKRRGVIDWAETNAEASKLLKRVGLDELPDTKVLSIGVGKQQLVEIAKALSKDVKLLVLDEPTAALNDDDSEHLLDLVRGLREQGIACVIISHKLGEIRSIADTITVIRDGQTVVSLDNSGPEPVTEATLIRHMVGRPLDNRFPDHESHPGDVLLRIEDWTVHHPVDTSRLVVNNATLEVRAGEVVGIAGLMGAGRTELAMSVFGKSYGRDISGKVFIKGREVQLNTVQDAIDAGLAYASEDRKRYGLCLNLSVADNTVLPSLEQIFKGPFVHDKKAQRLAQEHAEQIRTKTPSVRARVGSLSGGNQQKVVISKWILRDCDVLIFDEPTRGIDVGAKSEIYKLMTQLAEEGKSIIMISSDMPELLRLSDRVIVMCEGHVTGELDISEATQETIMTYATKREVG